VEAVETREVRAAAEKKVGRVSMFYMWQQDLTNLIFYIVGLVTQPL
jgi:hypothetical protein